MKEMRKEWEESRSEEEQRKRRFSTEQRRSCFKTVLCFCLDLLSASKSEPPVWIGYSRGKANFTKGGAYWDRVHDCAALSYTHLIELIEYLESEELIEHEMAGLSRILCSGRFHSDALKAFFEENGELVFRLDPFTRRPFPVFGRVAENEI